jgi:exodeoxyribonuclease V beta subunit
METFDPVLQPLDGSHSIEASAGTGKTFSITLLWLRLLIEKNLTVDQILVCTFTKAATAELRERLLASLRTAQVAANLIERGETPPEGKEALIVTNYLQSCGALPKQLSERLNQALSSFDLAPISTIHSFCQTLISRHSVEMGCDSNLRLLEDHSPLLQPLIDDVLMREAERPDLKIKDLRRVAETVAKNPAAELKLSGPESNDVRGLMARNIRETFPDTKTRAGVRGFDDILTTVHRALEHQGPEGPLAKAVRDRLRAAIVDECQDSDGIQIGVFESLFHHRDTVSFCVIGDPKQSIYRFRGADLASYKRLAAKAASAPPMTRNYRSDKPLIDALNALYAQDFTFPDALAPDQVTQYIPVDAAAEKSRIVDPMALPPLVFHWVEAAERDTAKTLLAEQVACECRRLLDSEVLIEDRHSKTPRRLQPGDIAVLASKHDELQLVRRKLTDKGIACQSSGLGSVFDSTEAFDILSWLELLSALENRGDVLGKLLGFLGSPLGGMSPIDLLALQQDAAKQAVLCAEFQAQLPVLLRSGPLPLLLKRLGSEAILRANLPFSEGERRYTNWRQIGALLQHEHGRGRKGPATLALWLARQTANTPKNRGEDSDTEESTLMKLETDSSTVQLVTIHSSKGLEYPVVFCPFLWHVPSRSMRKRNPVAVARTTSGWLLDASEDIDHTLESAMAQEDEEEHRKTYVALTRARHRLYLGVAPVPDTTRGGQHLNGAQRSALAALRGLQLDGDVARWHEQLTQFPHATLLSEPVDAPQTSPGTLLSTNAITENSHANSPLVEPPEPSRYTSLLLRTASFSGLSKTEHEQHTGADRDADTSDATTSTQRPSCILSPLGTAGAVLGEQLHGALEDFLGNRKELDAAISTRTPPEAWRTALDAIVNQPLHLGGRTTCLRAVRENCFTEMQFLLPVERLEPATLSEAFLNDTTVRENVARAEWATALTQWTFGTLAGYLQGFIDLIFEHEGRWFVVDYKSNRLDDYSSAALEEAMLAKNYLLQARLYALALHRHLQIHQTAYQFEEHFGGVAYLFVRGFPEEGVWFERPSLQALEALSASFHCTNP